MLVNPLETNRGRRATAAILVTLLVSLLAVLGGASPAHAAGEETEFFNLTNQARAQNGLSALAYDSAASNVARAWAVRMRDAATLSHNPNLASDVDRQVTTQWTRLGENVGVGGSAGAIQNAFMNSSGHRANILGAYNRVGVGVALGGDGRIWVTVVFIQGPPLSSAPPPAPVDTTGASAAARTDGRVEAVQRGADGSVEIRTFSNGSWSGWTSIGGRTNDTPTISAWGNDRLDVFVRGLDGQLWHRPQTSAGWGAWEALGGVVTAAPSAVSWGTNRIDVFVRGNDGGVWTRYYNGSGWSGWYGLGGYLSGAPAATAWGVNRLDVVGVGGDGQMWHRAWTGSGFTGWSGLGGRFTSGPGIASVGANRLSIFGRGTDGAVWTMDWNGARWTGWASLGGSVVSAPDAVARSGALDVLARAANGLVYQRTLTSGGWSGWVALP